MYDKYGFNISKGDWHLYLTIVGCWHRRLLRKALANEGAARVELAGGLETGQTYPEGKLDALSGVANSEARTSEHSRDSKWKESKFSWNESLTTSG